MDQTSSPEDPRRGDAHAHDGDGPVQALCRALRDAGEFTGVGAALLRPDIGLRDELGATDATFHRLAETQFTLWEGPGPEAFEAGHPVVGNVRTDARRWPLLTAEVGHQGLAAQTHVVLPLTWGGATIGLVGAYRADAGPVPDADLHLLSTYGRAIAATVARLRARIDPDEVAEADDAPVAIAVGMVMTYAGASEAEALARLRAHAFSRGTTLNELAREVMERRTGLSEITD